MIRQRHKAVWFAVTVLIGLCFLSFMLWGSREPSDQGSTLSQWLKTLDNPSTATNVQTITALRRMAPEAAVRLVPMLDASDSAFSLRAVQLAGKQHFVQIEFTPASVRWQRAEKAFEIMGDRAVAAAPSLVSLLVRRVTQPPEREGQFDESISRRDSADRAAAALGCLGYAAIPYLRPALYSEHATVRQTGIDVLAGIASYSTPETVSELIKLLEDSNPKVRKTGAYVLGKFPTRPKLAIPRLERTLGDVSPSVRRQAALTLGRFGAHASNSVAALRQACSDVAPEVRDAAAVALAQIGGEAVSSKDAATPDFRSKK
jgi:HEAT repeat protein